MRGVTILPSWAVCGSCEVAEHTFYCEFVPEPYAFNPEVVERFFPLSPAAKTMHNLAETGVTMRDGAILFREWLNVFGQPGELVFADWDACVSWPHMVDLFVQGNVDNPFVTNMIDVRTLWLAKQIFPVWSDLQYSCPPILVPQYSLAYADEKAISQTHIVQQLWVDSEEKQTQLV